MKKFIKCIPLFAIILFVSGCAKTQVTVCTNVNDQSKSGYKSTTTYKIYYKNDIVTKVDSEEILTSQNNTYIKYFEDLNKKQYETQNKAYGGYTYDVKAEKEKVISKLTIDYTKVNMNKFIEDNSAMKSYVNKDNKFTIDGAKTMYESLGATCK